MFNESLRLLLTDIIDYAGLFPPSQLSMSEAVSNYAAYKSGGYNWMLGRFVVPVARLDEFLEQARDSFEKDKTGGWRLSVLAGGDINQTLRRIKDFNAEYAPHAVCDSLEVKAATGAEIEQIAEQIPPTLTTYFEVPVQEDLVDLITTLAINNQRAKIRTGGVTAEAFPSNKTIIRFIRICIAANVPFKATAGLHHPVRCYKPLTYETDAPKGMMNGFLNLFLLAGFARFNLRPEILEELLEDEFEENFEFDESGVWWRQEYFLSNMQLKFLRERNAISFGSCSFEEPIEDLQEIELL